MDKFNKLKSIPSYLALQNIDTDMIIPKQFLKTIKRTGLGKSLFYEMRYDENGKIVDNFMAAENGEAVADEEAAKWSKQNRVAK